MMPNTITLVPPLVPPLPLNYFAALATGIISGLNSSNLLSSETIHLPILETYNLFYTEKQLRGIDQNFTDYNVGFRIPVIAFRRPLPRRLENLIRKSFSGDMSGDIGEALFAYYLLEVLGVPRRRIAHLRPEKRRRRVTSDFFVLNDGNWLHPLLGVHQGEVCAEVKSSTGQMTEDPVEHGLEQLYMTLDHGDYGVLFLVCRNDPLQGYVCYFVRVLKQ
jgi:hypothetical protein